MLQCYNGEQLLTIYNISHEAGVTQTEFEHLSAALVQQLLQGCASDDHDDDDDEPTTAESKQIVGHKLHACVCRLTWCTGAQCRNVHNQDKYI